jgi:hypothetical protein
VPFQILRAMVWVGIAIPVIRMLKGRWPETAVAIALLVAVVVEPQLRFPGRLAT